MIAPERIEQALSFLARWHRSYAELVDSRPMDGGVGSTQHNLKSRDEYCNAIEVIKALRSQLQSK